jgi:hypothetical protein
MTESNNWLVRRAILLLITALAMFFAPLLPAEAAVVKNLRLGDNKGYVRMVLEIDRPLIPPPSISIRRDTIQVSLTGILNDLSAPRIGEERGGIVSMDVSKVADVTRIEAAFSFLPADVKIFTLTGPHRFIIDAYRPVHAATDRSPIKKTSRISAPEGISPLPEPNDTAHESTSSGGAVSEASMKPHGAFSSTPPDAGARNRSRFQQQLIAALIAVTSIIAVLLFLLIWMGSGRHPPREPSWINHLPPTEDPVIENIDAAIRKHLKNHDLQ